MSRQILLYLWGFSRNIPRYSIPELSFTRTGLPKTLFRKSEGERFFYNVVRKRGIIID